MLPPIDPDVGIPHGRWSGTITEVAAAYAADGRRQKLWNDWLDLTAFIRNATGRIACAWIGGSFLTGKERPGDIDCVYFIPHDTPRTDAALMALSLLRKGQVTATLGLEVDAFSVVYWPSPDLVCPESGDVAAYLRRRAYWDVLWSRRRTAKEDRGLPVGGYVEVMIDGY